MQDRRGFGTDSLAAVIHILLYTNKNMTVYLWCFIVCIGETA